MRCLTETHAHSFPELSLSPFFERRWGSLYEAFEDGRIDQNRLRGVFAQVSAAAKRGGTVWLDIDATSIERPQSKTSPDRTVVYKTNLPESSNPISYGWQFSTVVLLPEQPSSWTAVLDQAAHPLGPNQRRGGSDPTASSLRRCFGVVPLWQGIAGTVVRRFCSC